MNMAPIPEGVFVPLRAFLLAYIVPAGTEVIQGLDDGVPMPAGPYVLMTLILQQRLSTNRHTYDDTDPAAGAQSIDTPMQLNLQLDFCGPLAAAWAAQAVQLLRDELACEKLGPAVQPLYCDETLQGALVLAEQRYLNRWICTAVFQYNPITTVPQEFADQAELVLVEVDTEYPPN